MSGYQGAPGYSGGYGPPPGQYPNQYPYDAIALLSHSAGSGSGSAANMCADLRAMEPHHHSKVVMAISNLPLPSSNMDTLKYVVALRPRGIDR